LKILQLCQKPPFPPVDGGCQLMHFAGTGLSDAGASVRILAMNPSRNRMVFSDLPADYKNRTRVEWIDVDNSIKAIDVIRNMFESESYFIKRFMHQSFSDKLVSILSEEYFDIIQIEHLYLCKYIPVIRKHSSAKVVLRMQNIEYVIWERYLGNSNNPFKKYIIGTAVSRLKKFETQIPTLLDGILALTDDDHNIMKSWGIGLPSDVIPMGYDFGRIKGYDYEKQKNCPPVIYHLGSMDWLPNIEAITWFIDYVYPIFKKEQPGIKIVLAGRHMPSSILKLKSSGLEVLEEINDPVKFQEDKAIMMVPLLSGSGIRAKIIEGLALGKVIVSTTVGAQGIKGKHGHHLLIADSPDEFAEQLLKCIFDKSLRESISSNALELGRSIYHSQVVANRTMKFHNSLINGQRD
jgi:polysaccharide biosynthesis protein PslH